MPNDKIHTVKEEILEKTGPLVRKAKDKAKDLAGPAEAVKAAEQELRSTDGCVPELYVQYSSHQYDCAELTRRCAADFRKKNKAAKIRSIKLYVKPEDDMVYYVINDIEDKLPLK